MSTVDDVLYRNEKGSALTFAELDNNFYKLALAIDNIQLANNATVVVRDSLGNFSANTITANLAGNSSTTTKFLTARTINGVSFDGSANITITSNTTQSLANGAYITGSSFNGGTARTWAVDAATAATASKIVARDASGNFAANTITAALVGNASTATTLQTARTISLGGDLSGSASFNGSADITITGTVAVAAVANNAIKLQTARTIFLGGDLSGSATFDGSANVTITATVAADSVALGTDTTGNYVASITNGSYITGGNGGSEGAALTLAVDATNLATASKVVARDASGNFLANTITAALTGNASTATTLQSARTIGDVSFNGSANIVPERITFKDTRSTDFAPYTYAGTTIHLKTNTTDSLADGGTYHGVLNLQHWSDSSGGRNHQLGFTDNGNIHHRSSTSTTTWSAWNRLYDTGDSSSSSTGGTLVLRDTNGSFSANVITASSISGTISGNASTATALQTARNISLGGDLSGSASFDGTSNITINATVVADSVALGTDTTGNYVASITNGSYITGGNGGSESAVLTLAVDAATAATASKVVARDASGNFAANTITAALTGNASTATTLQTARTINGVSFNGSANITITANTTNLLTFNNGGTGAASGSTFDGSAAVTISHNTIGASPLAGSTSLTTVGTITTGVWNAGAVNASAAIESGSGSGSAALTVNDGYGNSNIAFNHKSGTPDNSVTGSSGRITCAVDSATASMAFQLGNSTAPGVAIALTEVFKLVVGQANVTGDLIASGNVTAYSDRRLKSNIRTIDSALDKVTAMRGVYFDKDGKASVGVIAQEIEEVLPEVVLDGDYKSVAYGNIVGVLIEAIKELRAEIDELKRGK